MSGSRFLPDDHLAAIAWADGAASNVELARALGLPRARVWAVRRCIQRAGHWSCPLIWRTCPVCGDPIATGPKPYRRTMHPLCAKQRATARAQAAAVTWRQANPERYQALREREKARQRAAWRQLPAEERAAKLATFAAANQRDNARTLPHATRTGHAWTPGEDAVLMARAGEPDREAAIALGRTLWAVRNRKTVLRQRGDLPAVAQALARARRR